MTLVRLAFVPRWCVNRDDGDSRQSPEIDIKSNVTQTAHATYAVEDPATRARARSTAPITTISRVVFDS